MKGFISYSHQDSQILNDFHKHLIQLERDGIISTWTDNDIYAGSELKKDISNALKGSNLFIALLSPDYIASNYCYEKEFKEALEMQEKGQIIIIPVIIEPCDWLSTPLNQFKALPKDGKPISTWENRNRAFLDIIQNIGKLIEKQEPIKNLDTKPNTESARPARNYRVQKDFDSIEKMEFTEKTLREVKEHLKRYLNEVVQLDNIKTKILNEDNYTFECILVNRNKIDTEAELTLSISSGRIMYSSVNSADKQLIYSIKNGNNHKEGKFSLTADDYHLFWSESSGYSFNRKEWDVKGISDKIWEEWLASVGII